jgi:hypothetical protein
MYEDGQLEDMSVEDVRQYLHHSRVPFANSFQCMKQFVQQTEQNTNERSNATKK